VRLASIPWWSFRGQRRIGRVRRTQGAADDVTYSAFVDPSGGRADAFMVGIGHRDGERGVVDCLRPWAPPFNPSCVVEECAALLRDYRVHRVTGDPAPTHPRTTPPGVIGWAREGGTVPNAETQAIFPMPDQ
jgi:hypothetical protein